MELIFTHALWEQKLSRIVNRVYTDESLSGEQNSKPREEKVKRVSSSAISQINVTPFIDVCLVLLIIFMVITPMILKGFDVSIPPKANEQDNYNNHTYFNRQLILTVTAEGRILLNQEEIIAELLKSRLHDLFQLRRDKVIFFNAEDAVPYGLTVQIMDITRAAGAETIGIITEFL